MDQSEHFRHSFHDGDTIFTEGSPGRHAYLIEKGSVEISMLYGTKPVVLAVRHKGEVFGEMAIIDDQPRSATARALGDVELLVLPDEQIQHRLESVDPVLGLVLKTTLERFRETVLRLQNEAADRVETRAASKGTAASRADVERHVAFDTLRRECDLNRGLSHDELVLHYQPIVDLTSGSVVGLESLVRWNHPERGQLPPSVFLALAQDSFLIRSFGQHVVRQACQALQTLSATGNRHPGHNMAMHINISPQQIFSPHFVDDLFETVAEVEVDRSLIVLEVTERLLVERPEDALATLQECDRLGFRIALDDFGTGYSSFSHLSRFPLSSMKIDRDFIFDAARGPQSIHAIERLCAVAKTLRLEVIAEGIEDEHQVDTVRQLGCDCAQGFHYCRPLPLADMDRWLSARD